VRTVIYTWETLTRRFTLCGRGTGEVTHRRSASDAVWDLRELRPDPGAMLGLRGGAAHHGLRCDGDDDAFLAAVLADIGSGRLVLLAVPLAEPALPGHHAHAGAPPPSGPVQVSRTWIEVQVVDDHSPPRPFAALRYRIWTPDGSSREGELDARGCLRLDGLDPGTCRLELIDLRSARKLRPAP
jgi:hypothetical protein